MRCVECQKRIKRSYRVYLYTDQDGDEWGLCSRKCQRKYEGLPRNEPQSLPAEHCPDH